MNDYVLTGRGNPRELLRGMYFWTWQTQEVLAMVEWMREFNRSGRGRIQFTGFDMQTWTVAGDIVRAFVERAEPAYLAAVDQALRQMRESPLSTASAAEAVRGHLEENAAAYLANFTLAEVDWALQNARIVEQSARLTTGGSLYRDEMMAANTKWILDQNPGAKAVLWGAQLPRLSTAGSAGGRTWRNCTARTMSCWDLRSTRGGTRPSARRWAAGTGHSPPMTPRLRFPAASSTCSTRLACRGSFSICEKRMQTTVGAWLLGEMEFREIGAVQTGRLLHARDACEGLRRADFLRPYDAVGAAAVMLYSPTAWLTCSRDERFRR